MKDTGTNERIVLWLVEIDIDFSFCFFRAAGGDGMVFFMFFWTGLMTYVFRSLFVHNPMFFLFGLDLLLMLIARRITGS